MLKIKNNVVDVGHFHQLEQLNPWAIKHNILYNLSEQQLIDCSNKNHGCEGGSMDLAFEYMKNNSICSNISYPYI